MPLMSLHAIILQEMLEGGLHVRQMRQDGSVGDELTKEIIRVRLIVCMCVCVYVCMCVCVYAYECRWDKMVRWAMSSLRRLLG